MDFLNKELVQDTSISKNTTLTFLDYASFVETESGSEERSTESPPKDVNPVEGEMKQEKNCVFKENISAQSSLSSNFAACSNSSSLEEGMSEGRLWIEKGSLFSEFSSVNKKKASYCTSDDEDENLQQAKYGSIFEYDGAFPKKAFSPVIEPMNDSLFAKDKRFEWVDSIWGSDENNAVHMAKLEKGEEKKKNQENTHLQRSSKLLSCNFNSQSRSRAGTPDPIATQMAEQNLMSGMHVMVDGGDCHGAFGYIERVHDDFCDVCLFILATCETTEMPVANRFLKPMVPNDDMELTVNFAVFHARIYFCPSFGTTNEDGSYDWYGMKVWEVLNPAIKYAIPENSELVKINGEDISGRKFEELQTLMGSIKPPYSLTIKFPSDVQQIKITDLVSDGTSTSGNTLSTSKTLTEINQKNGRRNCFSKKNKNTTKRRNRGHSGKKFGSWKRNL